MIRRNAAGRVRGRHAVCNHRPLLLAPGAGVVRVMRHAPRPPMRLLGASARLLRRRRPARTSVRRRWSGAGPLPRYAAAWRPRSGGRSSAHPPALRTRTYRRGLVEGIQDSGEAAVGSRRSSSTLMILLTSNPSMSAVNSGPAMYAVVTAAGSAPFGVGDQGEQSVCSGVVVGPDAVRGDVDGPQAGDVAGPVRGRVVLECFGRAGCRSGVGT